MGFTATGSFTTPEGFLLSSIYVSIRTYTVHFMFNSRQLECTYITAAYKSFDDKEAGKQALTLSSALSVFRSYILPIEFYRQSFFGVGYAIVKGEWTTQGFTVDDVFEAGQPRPRQYIYDASGFNIDGFDISGNHRPVPSGSSLRSSKHRYIMQVSSSGDVHNRSPVQPVADQPRVLFLCGPSSENSSPNR